MAWENVRDEFLIEDIGAPLLANLAKGIYTPEAVLREYVQNAADAYVDLEEIQKKKLPMAEKTIDIYLQDNATLAIQDDGVGMNLDEIKHYKRIALSPKLGKERAGFRGIGIWAGFSSCDSLQVETTKRGDTHKYRLTLKFADMRRLVSQNINVKQLLDKRFTIEVDSATLADHYTQVKLIRLHDEFADLLKPEELERVVRQILPCRFDPNFKYAERIAAKLNTIDGYQEFVINVQDQEISKRFPANVTEPLFVELGGDEEEYAFAWYCASTTRGRFKASEPSNFRLRVRNIGVGGAGIYSQEDGSHWGVSGQVSSTALLDWYVGEIHVVHPDVKPNTPRSELELDAQSRRAIKLVRAFYEDRITYRRANSEVKNHLEQVQEITQLISKETLIEPCDAARWLKDIEKYETLVKPKKQKLQGIEAEKRRILKQLEAGDSDIAKHRREVIEHLRGIAGPSAAQRGKKGQAGRSGRGTRQTDPADASATTDTSCTTTAVDYEQLLNDIILTIEKQVGDQEELGAKLMESVQDIFKRHGLLVTV